MKNFSILRMEDIMAALDNPDIKLPENSVLLTFDDGYIDHFTFVFPYLKSKGLQGTFFIPGKVFTENVLLDVNKIHFILASTDSLKLYSRLLDILNAYRDTDWTYPNNETLIAQYAVANRFDSKEVIFIKRMLQTVLPEDLRIKISSELFGEFVCLPEDVFARELYMNKEQIKCMKGSGMFIGVHGYDHYWLGNLSEDKMMSDIKRAVGVLDGIINKKNWVMCYPYGSYNQQVVDYLECNGCRLGVTTDLGIAALDKNEIYNLPRFDCNDFPPITTNYLRY
ncbi:MAG: polysaccharide deacetylase family protein [Treponema sp.]